MDRSEKKERADDKAGNRGRGEMVSDDNPDYAVGYGKPPKDTQFKKGRSGNPKGRRKGAKNFRTLLMEELNQAVPVNEGGQRKNMSKRQAFAKMIASKALSGDERIVRLLLDLLREIEGDAGFANPIQIVISPDQASF